MSVLLGRRKPGSCWEPTDTLAALAWQAYTDSLCPGCGHPRHESMNIEHDGAYRAEVDRCHACTAIAVTQRQFAKEDAAVQGGFDGSAGRYFSSGLKV